MASNPALEPKFSTADAATAPCHHFGTPIDSRGVTASVSPKTRCNVKSSLSSFPETLFIEGQSKVRQILTNKFVSLSFLLTNSEFVAT
jgi:hypothetical protein